MEYPGAAQRGKLFISCIKEEHHSREVILQEHALLHLFSGVLKVSYADQEATFGAGDTLLIARNQLGRMIKLPDNSGQPFKSVSILFPVELLRNFYSTHPVKPSGNTRARGLPVAPHPLLQSVFNSLLPYFDMEEDLPAELADMKILETLTVLYAINPEASQLLGSLEEPGKIPLADFMEHHYMYNLPLERFSYLTGRSLTTFKKDFQQLYRTTPGRWLTQKRLELAHYQLSVQKKKPTDVYWETGFENLSHFSYAFKKQFGYNPATALAQAH